MQEKQNAKTKGFQSLKDWSTKDYGKNALVALLGGFICSMVHGIVWTMLGSILLLLGLILGVVWIYKSLRGRAKKV